MKITCNFNWCYNYNNHDFIFAWLLFIYQRKPRCRVLRRSSFLSAFKYSLLLSHEPGALHLSNHTNAEHFYRFCLQVFLWAGPPQRVAFLAPMEISVKCLSQGHSDALPGRESNRESAIFRLDTNPMLYHWGIAAFIWIFEYYRLVEYTVLLKSNVMRCNINNWFNANVFIILNVKLTFFNNNSLFILHWMLSNLKQLKFYVIDNLRKLSNDRRLHERLLNLFRQNCCWVVSLFWTSDVSNHSRRLPTFASLCFASTLNVP